VTATLQESAPADASLDPPSDSAAEPPQPAAPLPTALAPWQDPRPWVGWAITAALAVLAGFTRFWGLGYVHAKIFDEVYYATEAQEQLRYGYADNRGYMFIVHPPLGKWLIGAGSEIWGNNSFGWRVAPAVFGIVGVVLMTRIARRMFRSNLFGGIAGLLMALEGMSLVLARTAILDIFLQTFILAGFGALVLDRDQLRARLGRLVAAGADLSGGAPTLGPRPWRLLAGVCFGAACATKWTALSFWVAFVILSVVWDRAALKSAGVSRHRTRNWQRRSILPALGSLVASTVGVYLLSWLGWFIGENGWGRHYADTHGTAATLDVFGLHVPFSWAWVPGPIRALGSYTLQAYRFHEGLDSGHTYQSNPWSWLVLGRPVDFYYSGSGTACGSASCSREVLLIGTPLMWWAFVPMLLWLGWHWITTRDWRAAAVWVAFAAGWLVWFQDLKRTMFLFYMAPLVPFLILGVTLGLGTMLGAGYRRTGSPEQDERLLRRRHWGIAGVSVYLGLVIADFAWMWPIFTGGLLTYEQWHLHMWLPSWV
jgi:dolichyl-phosphate-mannose--protein O-mannosyl transferase